MLNIRPFLMALALGAVAFSSASWAELRVANVKDFRAAEAATLGTINGGYGIEAGQAAPDAELLNLEGEATTLSSMWEDQNLLLVFYRGGWCPFCNAQIRELTQTYAEFEGRSVLPIMISVDVPEAANMVDAAYDIPFPVMSDTELSAINAYNVAMDVSGSDSGRLERYEEYAGSDHHVIAVASAFLIGQGGDLLWSHADPEYQVRPTAEQILAVIDENLK